MTTPTPGLEELERHDAGVSVSFVSAPFGAVRTPLPPENDPVPELPPDLVPLPIRPWLTDVANRSSLPLEVVAGPAIVVLASLVGRTVGIRPERFDDWTAIPNLWGGIVLPPAMLKSHALAEATKALGPLEAKAREAFDGAVLAAEVRKVAIAGELGGLKKGASKRGGSLDEARVAELLHGLRECDEINERRYRTSDPTVAKLGELLVSNPRGLLLYRDELAGWARTLDQPGREGDREFFLECWDGNGSYTVDRIARGTLHVPALCLSVLGGIQPGKLRAYITEALAGGMGTDGFLQRFQILVWPDRMRPFLRPAHWPDTDAKRRAYTVYSNLDALTPETVGAECDQFNKLRDVPFLRFDDAAQELFDSWRMDLESRLRSPEFVKTPALAAHLGKYRSLMPSLALLDDLIGRVAGTRGVVGPIGLGSAQQAAAWCEFLEAHARKIYARELAPGRAAARALAAKIESGALRDGDTVRDVRRNEWAGLGNMEVISAGLETLTACGWVRVVRRASADQGGRGRPSEVIALHPELLGGGR